MSEVAHQPQPEPPDPPYVASSGRQRAQQRHIELYGDPHQVAFDLWIEEPLANLTKERISQEREEVREELYDAWGEFLYGNRLCIRKYQAAKIALERYHRELEEGTFPESRILQIPLLQKLLNGESVGVWSLEPLIAEARKDNRSQSYSDEELTECFEGSMNLYAQRHWIEIAYPKKGPHTEGEYLA